MGLQQQTASALSMKDIKAYKQSSDVVIIYVVESAI